MTLIAHRREREVSAPCLDVADRLLRRVRNLIEVGPPHLRQIPLLESLDPPLSTLSGRYRIVVARDKKSAIALRD